jgi:hypothetical protein
MRCLAVVSIVLAACSPAGRHGDDDMTGDDDGNPTCDPACPADMMCVNNTCTKQCAGDGADLIYIIDDQSHLHSFDPRVQGLAAFVDLGELSCPHSAFPIDGSDNDVAPMSMSVDRDKNAWVLYTSGEIFVVSLDHLDQCKPTNYTPGQAGMDLFGMGFVTDASGTDAEHLYIAGGDVESLPGGDLAVIDPTQTPPHATKLGGLTNDGEHSPELTGTGGGQLWGFFPGIDVAFVQQLDRTTGALAGSRLSIPGGLGGVGATPMVRAWAFAQWNGVFYIFATTTPGDPFPPDSTMRTLDGNGAYAMVLDEMPWIIVGAGVSTCAPFVIE